MRKEAWVSRGVIFSAEPRGRATILDLRSGAMFTRSLSSQKLASRAIGACRAIFAREGKQGLSLAGRFLECGY